MGNRTNRSRGEWERLDPFERKELLEHIRAVGCRTLDDYLDWREAKGIAAIHNLRRIDFAAERKAAVAAMHRARLSAGPGRMTAAVVEVLADPARHGELPAWLRAFARTIPPERKRASVRKAMRRLMLHLLSVHSALLADEAGLGGVLALASRFDAWLAEPEAWRPRAYSRERQFSSLVRHLFARYPVPEFMESAWNAGEAVRFREWYIALGRGGSIRLESGLLLPLTKARAAFFLAAPSGITIPHAFRWAQARAHGASPRLAEAICATRLGGDFGHADFWDSVVKFLADNPFIDLAQAGPIVDFLHNQKFVPDAAGRPPQPNLSMKGRSAESLLRAVAEWHRGLQRRSYYGQLDCRWEPCGLPPFRFLAGEGLNLVSFTATELLTGRELAQEGRRMHHCVASYTDACRRGATSIWSLVRTARGVAEPMLTVEINLRAKAIVQARGKLNRRPTQQELGLLHRWAQTALLTVSKWL